jgi:isoamylase
MSRPLHLVHDRIDSFPTDEVGGFRVRPGRPFPFGATLVPGGVNFSLFSSAAEAVSLVLFPLGEREPFAELPFPESCRIGGVWAMTVFGLDYEHVEYGYRVRGPAQSQIGDRFDPTRVLTDPHARALSGRNVWAAPPQPDDPFPHRARLTFDDFDWEGDTPVRCAHGDLVIYELHVRGYTRHPSSGVTHPGTYAGLVEKIPYLKDLGVNCVELMPVFEFDEFDNDRVNPTNGDRLMNYWGYSTLGFFAPKSGYAATGRYGMQRDEFKNLVKELHRAGIAVVLDVVFNHTAEGNENGPTIHFRGLDNRTYYMLTTDGQYYNFSGTGNTLNCNHPIVRDYILSCLRFWASEYHVDGFRFDLATILDRGQDGTPLESPPLVEALSYDPLLRDCILIAEAWDAGGLYQVGSFPDYQRWSEWNGRYRDVLRRFLRGDPGTVGELATRYVGSPDLYRHRGPHASINFVTCHDGFTLADLVAYNDKHNEENGEDNRDGTDDNGSWNSGVEGPSDDPQVRTLRLRQMKNAMALLLTSQGIPMICAGDEVARTQQGNNNAYCHDGPLTWFDWNLVGENEELFRFVRACLAFRAEHPQLRSSEHPCGENRDDIGLPDVSWHGAEPWKPDWSDANRLLAVMRSGAGRDGPDHVYLAANAHWEPQDLSLPELPAEFRWHRFADTSAAAPRDVSDPGAEPMLADQHQITIGPRSLLILVGRPLPSPAHTALRSIR